MAYIYALTDENNNIRYIGCTSCSLEKRFKEHLRCKDNTYKTKWIKSLLKNNKNPNIILIEEVNDVDMFEREIYWINFYSNLKLVNLTGGGEGVIGFQFSDIQRDKISKNTRKAMNNPEVRKKISDSKKGKPAHNRKKVKDQFGNIYNSISEAARKYSLTPSAITQGIKSNRPVNTIVFEVV